MTDPNNLPRSLQERLDRHRRMAESYHQGYAKRSVQDGETYDEWVFAPEATYASPYFGSETIDLVTHPISVRESATMEAVAYSVRFDNWGPVDFQAWPSDRGFAMATRFEGARRTDGVVMGFHAYGFVDTDQDCRITHWETHVSRDYDDFLDIAIGVHGPFTGDAADYLAALGATLAEAGVKLPGLSA
ncbi:MAG: hypothetical protein IT193_10750 [Propionibacteriaceae bacterium]|nr:hypothetical protein [Propionibacteriaceae bacterium]